MKLDVYFADVSALNDNEIYRAIYEKTSAERRKTADRYAHRKNKNLSIGASMLLNAGLENYGLHESNMIYRFGANGKPYFENAPFIQFSISHSDDKVMVCFSECEAGCDIERIRDIDFGIAKRFFCPSEYEAILAETEEAKRNDTFFRFWTLKESYLKMTGKGFAASLNSFEIVIDGDDIGAFRGAQKENVHFLEIEAFNGFRSAVCSREKIDDIKCHFISAEDN